MQHKFRAWDKINNVMREVKEISFYYKEVTIKMAQENKSDALARGDHVCSNCDDHTDDIFDFEYIDLIQFTGFYAGDRDIKDENLEIYDGDILEFPIGMAKAGKVRAKRGTVCWDQDFGKWIVITSVSSSPIVDIGSSADICDIPDIIDSYDLWTVNRKSKIIGSSLINPELLEVCLNYEIDAPEKSNATQI